jgi:thymidine kinase
MPQLYFRHGTMNSSKTANLLMVAHNYTTQGKKVLLVKPSVDTRFGDKMIRSRAMEGTKADLILTADCKKIPPFFISDVSCVLVDEAQFLSPDNVEALRELTTNVPVICYGLRTDYQSKLFPGSKRLLEIADKIEEIKTICTRCDRKAIINAKFDVSEGRRRIVYNGSNQPELGAEEKYQPMCWNCWKY